MKKNERSYERLRHDIISGEFQPGQKLVVSALSKRYKVSPMPVREALSRLEQEGLIKTAPNRGAWVHKCDYEQFFELIQMQILLESYASRIAAEKMDEAGHEKLDILLRIMTASMKEKNFPTYQLTNNEFHMFIYKSAENASLYRMIQDIHAQNYPYSTIALLSHGRLTESMREHHEWAAAIKNRDGEKSAKLCVTQRVESYILFLDFLDVCVKKPDDPQSRFYLYGFSDAFAGMDIEQIKRQIQYYRDQIGARFNI